MFNPYQFLQEKVEKRPYNEENKRDGNFNYIHETWVWTMLERMEKEKKPCPLYTDYKKSCQALKDRDWELKNNRSKK